MGKYFIEDKVDFWKDGRKLSGTVYSAKRKLFGKIEYTVAVKEFAGFDPEGIGQDKYRYYPVSEDDILPPAKHRETITGESENGTP